ncbi:hypothetical protein ACFX2B_013646 [Malus domestica]
MESEGELKATASPRGEGVCSESESIIDVFSKFPDQISHHIVSFLTVTDLTRFGCVSKRCRELCLSSPKLNFDGFSLANTSTCYYRLKLLSYLDRFFFHRGDSRIQSFRVRWFKHEEYKLEEYEGEEPPCFCGRDCYEGTRMFTWIQNAVRCKVEVLDLETDVSDSDELEPLPSCVFQCETLRYLVLHVDWMILRTPSFTFPSNLKYLELKKIVIENEGFFKWISCCCKCIEELNLREVHGIETMTIKSSSMKKLRFSGFSVDLCHINISCEKLEGLFVCWYFASASNKSLNIFAPNLKHLKWVGNMVKHPNLGKFECLADAALSVNSLGDDKYNVFEVLDSLCRAKSLILDEATIKDNFRGGSRPAPLYDTFCLGMGIDSFVDELIPAIVFLLRGMPNLFNLLLMNYNLPLEALESNTSGVDIEYWKLQNLAFVYQLRQVTIELCNGSNGIEFAKYVLECAPNLEKMVIVYLPQDLEKVARKLEKSKISNAAAAVFFQEKPIKR